MVSILRYPGRGKVPRPGRPPGGAQRPAGSARAQDRAAPTGRQIVRAARPWPTRSAEPASPAAAGPAPYCRAGNARPAGSDPGPQDWPYRSVLPIGQHLFDRADGLSRIQIFRTRLGAIHDRVATIEPVRILQRIESLAGRLVAAIDDPAVRGQQRRRTQEALRVAPIARAGRRAAGTQDARGWSIDVLLVLLGLQLRAIGRRRRVALQ